MLCIFKDIFHSKPAFPQRSHCIQSVSRYRRKIHIDVRLEISQHCHQPHTRGRCNTKRQKVDSCERTFFGMQQKSSCSRGKQERFFEAQCDKQQQGKHSPLHFL